MTKICLSISFMLLSAGAFASDEALSKPKLVVEPGKTCVTKTASLNNGDGESARISCTQCHTDASMASIHASMCAMAGALAVYGFID